MSFITKNYKVEYIISNTVHTDITDFIVSLDSLILQSTGKLAEGRITLNGEFGNFMTNANSGATPIIEQFDLIRVTIIGDDGTTEQQRVFEVTTDLAQIAFRSSYFLPIELEGRERNLSGVPFGGFFRNSTHKDMILEIRGAYNEQAKVGQPAIISTFDNVPDFNPNIWDFTQVDNCYDALLIVLDSLNLPVSAGGGGNRYAMYFDDVYNVLPTDIELAFIDLIILKQGTNNGDGPYPVLQQNDEHPIRKIDKIKRPSTGTVVVARGRPKTAVSPQNYSLFIGRLEFYRALKQWDSLAAYPQNSYVTHDANVGGWPQRWQANSNTLAGQEPGVSGNWTAIDVGDYIGDLQYSPFTVDKVGPIKNGFANPTGAFDTTSSNSIAVPDHNLSINDVRGTYPDRIGTFRDWVYFRTNDPSLARIQALGYDEYLKNGAGGLGYYNGFRVLVDDEQGALVAPFNGNDANGLPFAGNMAIFITPKHSIIQPIGSQQGEWFVVREHQEFDQCAVYAESTIYEWNVDFDKSQIGYRYPSDDRKRGGLLAVWKWRDISDIFLGNDCFHNPISVSNVQGLIPSILPSGEPLNDIFNVPYNDNSGIQVVFGFNQANETQDDRDVWFKFQKRIITGGQDGTEFVVQLGAAIFNTFVTPQYTNMGWWFVWPSPYPFSTYNGIGETVGELYGGNFASLNDHRYFDMFNIQYTTDGLSGWVHADSTDLSEITGVEFLFNYDIRVNGVRIPLTGDVPFAYWCLDKFGTLWKSQKIMYRHLGETQEIKIEFGDLSPVFRGRTPLGIDNILENIIVAEIEINEQFFKESVVFQGFQCETPYDEYGRYSPNLWEQVIKPVTFDVFGQTGNFDVDFIGIIDAYGFTKTPIAISTPNALALERTIIPQFEDYQNIINVEQLQRFADASAQIEQWPYEQYTVEQGGINDLSLEDSVALFDPYLINEADQGVNTRVVALREIHYSVPSDSALIRKGVFVKVIE
jgi:hypothetical protein